MTSLYNIACCHSKLGDARSGLVALAGSAEQVIFLQSTQSLPFPLFDAFNTFLTFNGVCGFGRLGEALGSSPPMHV